MCVKSPYTYLVELQQGQRRWLHTNKLRPYHACVNALIGNCAIVYESDEEFGTLPVINSNQSHMNLPSNRINPAKLEHLNADQKHAFLELLDMLMFLLKNQVYAMKVCMKFMLPLILNLNVSKPTR